MTASQHSRRWLLGMYSLSMESHAMSDRMDNQLALYVPSDLLGLWDHLTTSHQQFFRHRVPIIDTSLNVTWQRDQNALALIT